MLERLSVSNFALIESVEIDLTKGFNVFTGETGAGKSIVLDAVGAILGARSSGDYIRNDADSYCIQAAFNVANLPHIHKWLQEHGIEAHDNELFLLRRLNRAGKNIITVNGVQLPLNALRELGGMLVDMHAQHHNQLLLQQSNHLGLLDAYADSKLKQSKQDYRQLYAEHKALIQEIEETRSKAKQREQSMDILTWQIQEIEEVKPKEQEYENLQAESKRLSNMEKIRFALENAHALIESEKGSGLIKALTKLENNLEVLAKYEARFGEILDGIREWQYVLSDAKMELADYYERLEQSPMSLEKLQERLDALYRLYKKYGDYEQTVAFLNNAKAEYEQLAGIDDSLKALLEKEKELIDRLKDRAQTLTNARQSIADRLSKDVQAHIRDLAMPEAVFVIQLLKREDFGVDGWDEVVFTFSANKGQEVRPVNKIASGGEVSRIFLALKTVLMSKFNFATMIFDEVDTGVSGSTAQRMAEKLILISKSSQVLCVTHLPQVACMADTHIKISKKTTAGRTLTNVHTLSSNERVDEIATMIAGDNQTLLTRESAAQLLDMAKERKKELAIYKEFS